MQPLLKSRLTDRELIVARNLLPDDAVERETKLHDYFGELIAYATEHPQGWIIELRRPPSVEFYVDPRLSEGLDWWSRSVGPISIDQIPFAYVQRQGFHLSFSDAWTLVSWSEYFEHHGPLPKRVTLLHVDDHRDMMSPRLALRGDHVIDLLTSNLLTLTNSLTVREAVASGAIGMGSFIVPFLHYGPPTDFRHLCATRYGTGGQLCPISLATEDDSLVSPGSKRPSVDLSTNNSLLGASTAHCYMGTSDLDIWLQGIRNQPILLHIDMDYLNNRFDGDSDWIEHADRHDPPLDDILTEIDRLFEQLARNGVVPDIEDCSVSLSPGFFPAEFWEPSVARVQEHIQRLHAMGLWRAGYEEYGT